MDSAVDWLFRNPWILWVVTIIAVAICGIRNEHLMKKRLAQAKCARCGKDFDEETRCEQIRLAAQGMIVLMCPACKAHTLRNYRAVYYLVLLLLLFRISALIASIVEVLAKGSHVTWKDIRVALDELPLVIVIGMLFVELRKALMRPTPSGGKLES